MGTGQGSTAGIAGGVAVGVLMTGGADLGAGSDFLTTVFAVGITGVTVSGAGGVLFATDLGLAVGTRQRGTAGIAAAVVVAVLMAGGGHCGTGSDLVAAIFAVGVAGVTIFGAGSGLGITDFGFAVFAGKVCTAAIAGLVTVAVLMTGSGNFRTGSDLLTAIFAVGIAGVTILSAGSGLRIADFGFAMGTGGCGTVILGFTGGADQCGGHFSAEQDVCQFRIVNKNIAGAGNGLNRVIAAHFPGVDRVFFHPLQ